MSCVLLHVNGYDLLFSFHQFCEMIRHQCPAQFIHGSLQHRFVLIPISHSQLLVLIVGTFNLDALKALVIKLDLGTDRLLNPLEELVKLSRNTLLRALSPVLKCSKFASRCCYSRSKVADKPRFDS